MNESSNAQSQPPQAPHRHWSEVLKHRWPTLAGITLAIVTILGGELNRELISSLSTLIVFMAFIYLAAAVLGRRSSAWLVFLVGLVPITLLKIFDLNTIGVFSFLGLAFVFLVVGFVHYCFRS